MRGSAYSLFRAEKYHAPRGMLRPFNNPHRRQRDPRTAFLLPDVVEKCPTSVPSEGFREERMREFIDKSVERVMGIEPTSSAWEAEVLPLNYTRYAAIVGPDGASS